MIIMVSPLLVIVAVFITASIAGRTAPKSDIIWDGRIPHDFSVSGFDDAAVSPFNVGYNKGKNQTWSEIIKFPQVQPALFDDISCTKPWEVTINDKSIFEPGDESSRQNGFRRSEVMPITNNGSDASVQGTTTLHFSVMKDSHRPLNSSHFYHVSFLETADYSSHIWTLNTGLVNDNTIGGDPETLRLESGSTGGVTPQPLFQAKFRANVWHNFAVQVDFDNNALSAYYSVGNSPLKRVVKKTENDSTGKGQYHLGLIKQPTGETDNVVKKGYQPANINEGIIFGGVFLERGMKVSRK